MNHSSHNKLVSYLSGFSSNVKEIIRRFKLLEQMRHMADKQVLLDVIENFISPYINLTPREVIHLMTHLLANAAVTGKIKITEDML